MSGLPPEKPDIERREPARVRFPSRTFILTLAECPLLTQSDIGPDQDREAGCVPFLTRRPVAKC